MKAQFIDLLAAADFLEPGAVEVNRYQSEITDIVRRRGVLGQRIRQGRQQATLRVSLRKPPLPHQVRQTVSWTHATLWPR